VEKLAAHDIRYVAHEYLTPHGDPFWFDEVASAMAKAGLAFAGSLTPADNYRDLMVPPAFRDLAAAQPARAPLEALRDTVANTRFRRDLYVAQPAVSLAREVGLRALAGTAFCLADLPEALPMKRAQGWLQFDLDGDASRVRAIHGRLAGGPAGIDELHAAVHGRDENDTAFLIQQLVVSGHLAPCPPDHAPAGWMAVNSTLVETAIREQRQHVPLACPLTGAASDTEVVSAATIEAAAAIDDAAQAAACVLSRLRVHGHPINRLERSGAKRPATDDEIMAHVAAVWRGLRDPASADRRRLQLLGIV
jgi:hypothetical protein